MSRAQVHDAGQFNRQLSIENLVAIPDQIGGFAEQYIIEDSVWAHLCPQKSTVQVLGEQQATEITHRVLMRFRNGIKPGSRLITGSRRFEVITVQDVDETRRYLELMVVEK